MEMKIYKGTKITEKEYNVWKCIETDIWQYHNKKVPECKPVTKHECTTNWVKKNGKKVTQCAPAVFNLDQKFRSRNGFFSLLWCKTSQNQPKNSSVNRFPLKIAFSAVKWGESVSTFSEIPKQKTYLEGKPVNRWILWLFQICFTSNSPLIPRVNPRRNPKGVQASFR